MNDSPANTTLKPDVRLPLLVVALGFPLLALPLHPWPTLVVVLFGLFLLIQSASLRLEFEERALIVWQNGRELRRFPYDQWLTPGVYLPHGCRDCSISERQIAFILYQFCSTPSSYVSNWSCV